jgi:hypothetical protein
MPVQTPHTIHVAVDMDALEADHMTLRELRDRVRDALRAEFPTARVLVEESDLINGGFTRCTDAEGDPCDNETAELVEFVVDEAWRRYMDEEVAA